MASVLVVLSWSNHGHAMLACDVAILSVSLCALDAVQLLQNIGSSYRPDAANTPFGFYLPESTRHLEPVSFCPG